MSSSVLGACLQLHMVCWDTEKTRGNSDPERGCCRPPAGPTMETPSASHLQKHIAWRRFDGTAVPDRQPHRLSSPLKRLLLHFSKNITLSQHRREKSVGGGTSCCLLPAFDIKQIKSALDSVASASHIPAAHRWGSRVASSICTLRQEPQMFGSSPTRVPQTGM